MAESTTPRIQFGDEIKPVKSGSATVYATAAGRNPSLSEKYDSNDVEIGARNVADEDINRKKKQVRQASSMYSSDIGAIGCGFLYQTLSNLTLII
jgi:hypothetical protein